MRPHVVTVQSSILDHSLNVSAQRHPSTCGCFEFVTGSHRVLHDGGTKQIKPLSSLNRVWFDPIASLPSDKQDRFRQPSGSGLSIAMPTAGRRRPATRVHSPAYFIKPASFL